MSVTVVETVQVWPEPNGHDIVVVDQMEKALQNKLESLYGENAEFQLKKNFHGVDKDGDNKVTSQEFVTYLTTKLNFQGYDSQVAALFKRYDIDKNGSLSIDEFVSIITNSKGASKATSVIGKIREIMARRAGGISTIRSMGIQFQLADKNKDGNIDKDEFETAIRKFVGGFGLKLTIGEIADLFAYFDEDNSGHISYDEFLRTLRGDMNERRVALVKLAFGVLDKDKSGTITMEEMASVYDTSKHPLVVAGKCTKQEALNAMLGIWNKGKGKVVTEKEFIEYYQWISASIDHDDYFELMIRNAWHISGGTGWSENTTCLRVLVIHTNGNQTIEEVKNDFGLDKTDVQAIRKKLESQGIKDIKEIQLNVTL